MPYYRLYQLNHADRIERFDEFDAPHDAAATVLSRGRLAGHSLELWQQERKVIRLDPEIARLGDGGMSGRASPQ